MPDQLPGREIGPEHEAHCRTEAIGGKRSQEVEAGNLRLEIRGQLGLTADLSNTVQELWTEN